MIKLNQLSIKDIILQFRSGSLTPETLVKSAQDNHNLMLSAYRDFQKDSALEMALLANQAFVCGTDLGPLQGIPISIKDLYGVHGTRTFAGSPNALPASYEKEGPVVKALRNQLAAFMGKTHTVEFAFGGLGVNTHWGTPRNPWDSVHHKVPGGSSCGAGVSLQEGSALLALGSDTAGSVRVPASMTSCVGLKTSFGRWSLEGIFPLSPTLDTAGILSRTVEDALIGFAAIDPAFQGEFKELLYQADNLDISSITISKGDPVLWEDCESGIEEVAEKALEELTHHGVKVVDSHTPEIKDAIELFKIGSIAGIELKEFLLSKLPSWIETADPIVGTRIRDSSSFDAHEYLRRCRIIRDLTVNMKTHFSKVDLIASPTVPISPPHLDEVNHVDGYGSRNIASLRNTSACNILGLCGITLPVGLDSESMPVGLQLLGPHNSDPKLLCIARCFEKIWGTSKERVGNPSLA